MINPIIQHLSDLRQAMKANKIDAYIQPSSDPHLSEYVAPRFMGREFLTGFTGSAGTCIVTEKEALLYTDGRYFIQAEQELEGTGIQLMKMGMEGYPTMKAWLTENLDVGMTVGLDGRLFSKSELTELKVALAQKEIHTITDKDLLVPIWKKRPDYPLTEVFVHELKYAGQTVSEKLAVLRDRLSAVYCDAYILSALNDLAWLFNIRANDVAYTPVVYAYALITPDEARLYIHQQQLEKTVMQHLNESGVTVCSYDSYYDDLKALHNQTIYCDPDKINGLMAECLSDDNDLQTGEDLVYHQKACVNETEAANWHNAQVRDGVAMVQFLHWLDNHVTSGQITEYEAEQKVTAFRAAQDLFVEPSFRTIAAYGPNGAMMHYSTPEENSPLIQPEGFFLLDSGGQYPDGTTDITRTVAVGPLTDEMKTDFTLVLKSHARLNMTVFLKGISGTNLDMVARQPMWDRQMDYKSGTGHSIGYFLSVHEGPGKIRKEPMSVKIKPGMVLTNEPGVYKEGKYGIRTENTVMVKEVGGNQSGTYLGLEVISFCPIDLRAVKRDMLSESELEWLNQYHQKVYSILSPFLNDETTAWLKEATRSI